MKIAIILIILVLALFMSSCGVSDETTTPEATSVPAETSAEEESTDVSTTKEEHSDISTNDEEPTEDIISQITETKKGSIIINFDPDPLPVTEGQVNWKLILTETNGVGVTVNKLTRQAYMNGKPVGDPKVHTSDSWFQNLPGTYLPPNGEGIIGAGAGFGDSTPENSYFIDTIEGIDDNGNTIIVEGRLSIANEALSTGGMGTAKAAITVSYDPDPLVVNAGHVSWKVILTETNGVGVTVNKLTRQAYMNGKPVGDLKVYTSDRWFQNLPGTYLPPNGVGIIGAGTNFGDSIPEDAYYIDTIEGTDDNGNDITVEGRLDITQ